MHNLFTVPLLPPTEPQREPGRYAADRTRSPRHRAGSRRNKRMRNVPSFSSDRRG